MAKDAYRATNRRDILPQMVLWLEQKEKIFAFSSYIEWRLAATVTRAVRKKASAKTYTDYHWITLPKTPSIKRASLSHIAQSHGANDLQRALASFVSMRQRYLNVPRTPLPSSLVLSMWYHFKISNLHVDHLAILNNFDESVHSSPQRTAQQSKKTLPARFDTVLVNEIWDGRDVGLRGYRIARVRAVFTLPPDVTETIFGRADAVQQLAYIDARGLPEAAVIELGQIRQSVHLFPKFPKEVLKDPAALEWTSDMVLDQWAEFDDREYLTDGR
ncbi:hypothetical protein FRC01_007857 [Tulasnella sp. 417]|nr:hypothetical protein FRC01_007857 [Tulasnella sp. 417]